jgi:hypothetical protein
MLVYFSNPEFTMQVRKYAKYLSLGKRMTIIRLGPCTMYTFWRISQTQQTWERGSREEERNAKHTH